MKFARFRSQLPLALGLSLMSYSAIPANSADPLTTVNNSAVVSPSLAIRNIYVNPDKQLVVEFDNPNHLNPIVPQVKDYPGDKHDIVLEFSKTTFAIDKAPKAKTVLDELIKVYPELNSLSYATANDGTKSRIRIGVSPDVSAHPSLAKIDQDHAVINLYLSEKTTLTSNKNVVNDKPLLTQNSENTSKGNITADVSAGTNSAAEKSIKDKTFGGIRKAGQSLGKIATIHPFAHKSTEQQSASANTDTSDPNSEKAKLPAIAADKSVSANSNQITSSTNVTSDTDASNKTTAEKSIKDKTVSGIKDAWASSLKAGQNLGKIATIHPFVHKSTEQQSAPANSDITDNSNGKAQSAVKEDIKPVATEPTASAIVAPKDSGNSELTQLKPEIADKESVVLAKDDKLASLINKGSIENQKSAAPIISANAEELKTADEPIITPLSVEQALKEKASFEAANPQKPSAITDKTSNQPISIENKSANSFASDFKTDFSKPADNNTDKKDIASTSNGDETKEKAEKVASLPANPLDSLTSAALSSASNEQSLESDEQASAAVKLKAQKAHAGGKDYFPPKFDDEAVDHYNAAVRAHLDGKLTEAIAEYKAAIESDGKIAEAYSNLGLIYNQLHNYDLAMSEFHKALVINPKDAITYNGIGAAMRAKNNLVAAIKNWQTAINLDPNLASAHYNLGTAYEINKDMEKALAQYKEAVKHDDKLGEAYYRMGLILQKMNNKNLALEDYKQAIKVSQQASYASDAKRRINLLSQSKNNSM